MQYDDLFMIDAVIAPNGPMKAALHIKDLIATFAKIDSNFLNFICITRVIYSLYPGGSGKANGFSFFMF